MLKNVNYNIIEMISENSQTLHRIETYMKDSSDCRPCQEIWKKVRENREQELSMLMDQLKKQFDSGMSPQEERAAA